MKQPHSNTTHPDHSPCQAVLIIEDNEDLRELLVDGIGQSGFTVHSSSNGQNGLELLNTISDPCLICLDFFTPGMDGATFLEKLRQLRPDGQDRIILVTGNAEELPSFPAVVAVVQKPFQLKELLSLIRQNCKAY